MDAEKAKERERKRKIRTEIIDLQVANCTGCTLPPKNTYNNNRDVKFCKSKCDIGMKVIELQKQLIAPKVKHKRVRKS